MSDTTDDNVDTSESDEAEMRARLFELKEKHRQIDTEIKAVEETGVIDVLKIRRMKKIKLSFKDEIAFLENELTPDIIA